MRAALAKLGDTLVASLFPRWAGRSVQKIKAQPVTSVTPNEAATLTRFVWWMQERWPPQAADGQAL
jgi:hypothetical protein